MKKHLLIFVVLLLSAVMTLSCAAETTPEELHELGIEAYNQGDYETAYKYISAAAASGYAKSQYGLGYMYAKGQGVDQSYEMAAYFYQLSADQGYPSAQVNLGNLYTEGNGVEQSHEKAS